MDKIPNNFLKHHIVMYKRKFKIFNTTYLQSGLSFSKILASVSDTKWQPCIIHNIYFMQKFK